MVSKLDFIKLPKGFIYTVLPPRPRYVKSDAVLEYEQMSGRILTDWEAEHFNVGYKFGRIDQESEDQMACISCQLDKMI